MRGDKRSITAYLPCCDKQEIQVTKRQSKQVERPRRYKCKRCGQEYDVKAAGNKIISSAKVYPYLSP